MGLGHHALELSGVAGDPASRVHRLDPRAKILALLGVVAVALSTPLSAWPVYVACALALAGIALAAQIPAATIWRRGRLVLALVLLVALTVPFVRSGGATHALGPLTVHEDGLVVLGTVAAKATLGILAAILLSATTSFPALLDGLRALRVPRVPVMIAGLTHRYLFVLVDEVARMRAALVARAYRPRTALGSAAIGRVAGALFLRTYGRGERVHQAMLARGYDGRLPQLAPLAFTRVDAAFVGLVVGALLALRLLAGLQA